MSSTAHQLLQRIRKAGGEVRLGPDGKLQHRNVPQPLKRKLARNYYLIQTWLAEQRASVAWEASGKNPEWWRSYSPALGGTYVSRAANPGTPPNCELNGADPFDALKELVRKRKNQGEQR